MLYLAECDGRSFEFVLVTPERLPRETLALFRSNDLFMQFILPLPARIRLKYVLRFASITLLR